MALLTNDNDYQIEQANSAAQMASKLGVEAKIVYADNDAINQSTQILKAIQAAPEERPDAIVFEPVGGTAFPQVARAAAAVGVGWVVMNRETNYITELRQTCKTPVFVLSSDHIETGRIQGRQFAALLPGGGSVLHIQGPSDSLTAKERLLGTMEVKPANIHFTTLKGQWTEESAQRAVRSWLMLSTSQKFHIDLIGSQNDAMAIGARKVFQEISNEAERDRWLNLPFTGCDGLPKRASPGCAAASWRPQSLRLRWRGKPLNCWLAHSSMAKYHRSACSLRPPRSRGLRRCIPRSADQTDGGR